jgi:hypothetical protein
MSVRVPGARRRRAVLLACAALGAFIACLADRLVKSDASATKFIAEILWSDFHLGDQPEPAFAFGLLVIIAALLSLVFDPRDKKAAFGIGVGILSSLLTITPYHEKAEIPLVSLLPAGAESGDPGGRLLDRLLGVRPAWAQDSSGAGFVHLIIQHDGAVRECTLTLLDLDRRTVVGRSRFLDRSDFRIRLAAGRYQLTVEAPGSQPGRKKFDVEAGRTVEMRAVVGRGAGIVVR